MTPVAHGSPTAVRVRAASERPLFTEIEPPEDMRAGALESVATWLTWSPEFRDFLGRWCSHASASHEPRLTDTSGDARYGRTLTSQAALDRDPGLAAELEGYARALAALEPGDRVLLLDGLLDGPLDGHHLPSLLAALRDALVLVHGESGAALYAPLGTTGTAAGEFELHADLYVPHKLMNVFDEVPADGTGVTRFLSTGSLMAALAEARVPRARIERVRTLLERPLETDGFDEFFGLLYPEPRVPWRSALEEAIGRRELRIGLRRGQGYVINDRRWLHGRDAPTGGVSSRRLHRLVFS